MKISELKSSKNEEVHFSFSIGHRNNEEEREMEYETHTFKHNRVRDGSRLGTPRAVSGASRSS